MPPVAWTSLLMKTSPSSSPSCRERATAVSHGIPTIRATPVATGAAATSPRVETRAAPKSEVSLTKIVCPARRMRTAISSTMA